MSQNNLILSNKGMNNNQTTQNLNLYAYGKNHNNNQNPIQLKQIQKNVKLAAAGQNHLIYITNNNEVYAMGSNKFGQLAISNNNNSDKEKTSPNFYYQKPYKILETQKIKKVFCGAQHSFFINQKNQVYCAGFNIKGQLGIGTFQNVTNGPKLVINLLPYGKKNPKTLNSQIIKHPKPPIIDILQKFDLQVKMDDDPLQSLLVLQTDQYIDNISCGALFTIALSNKGRLFGCGFQGISSNNQSSDEFLQKSKFRLILIQENINYISAGLSGAAAITVEGQIYCWGRFGKIINNIPKKLKKKSKQIMGKIDETKKKFVKVKVGDQFLLALSMKGQVYSMGVNIQNQLGKQRRITLFCQDLQKVVLPNENFAKDIFVGRNSCFVISVINQKQQINKNSQVIGWGSNRYGQISLIPEDPITMNPLHIGIFLSNNDQIIASSYSTFILSQNKPQFPLKRLKHHVQQEEQNQAKGKQQKQVESTVKLSQYKKLLSDYQILKSLNLTLLQKCQPVKKQSKQVQTSSKFQVTGVTKHRKFDSNVQIEWKQLTIQSQINQGGYGIIYKAKWRQTPVVVKKFKIQNGDVSIRDFLSQCHAMEAVRHPNIVMFLGAVIKNPHYSIILEYCSKGSLWSYLQNTQIQISWQQRRRIAKQIARGVLYLHLCNPPIIHRDLKSLNIFLDSYLTVKIGDFGWTKTLDEYMTNKIGTYQWMAPQVIGNRPYSQKVDVFSYSIILWEIASRQPPYKNINGVKVSEGVLNNDLRPPIPKKTPQPFAKLMKRCWQSNPDRRPDFKQIIQQLQIMKL